MTTWKIKLVGMFLLTAASLWLGGCVSDHREITMIQPTYSYLNDPVAMDALAAWPTLPTLAQVEDNAGQPVADIATNR